MISGTYMDSPTNEVLEVVPEILYVNVDSPETEVVIGDNSESEDTQEDLVGQTVKIEYVNDVHTSDDAVTYILVPNNILSNQIVFDCRDSEEIVGQLEPGDVGSPCILCGETFINPVLLQDHFNAVHAHCDLICDICQVQCSSDTALLKHYEKHRYTCDLCDVSFSKYQNLMDHKKTHLTILPYACNICGKAYSTTKEISLHIRSTHKNSKMLGDVINDNGKRETHETSVPNISKRKLNR